jgi:transglutaminase/protease-like cytokinesis protein 3
MGKFLQMMSQNDSKALVARASQINVQAKIAQQAIVQNLKNEIANVEIEIQNLTDFAPDTTQSLRPGVKGWQPTKWASDLQEAKTRLYELNIELKIAEATEKEFFGDEDTDIVAE